MDEMPDLHCDFVQGFIVNIESIEIILFWGKKPIPIMK
jgi:hypothetical protein